ncbi:hypothetical protein GCM10023205_63610 [Yinghuangia aomiensis]|uniref:DUF3558 domain-containing protein n=1 Tax=Yinghuangia aomiensis TaxID=676205 RepID=A0ABP9I117_9ACTN
MAKRRLGGALAASSMWLVSGCFGSGAECCAHGPTSPPVQRPATVAPLTPPTPGSPAAPRRATGCELVTAAEVRDAVGVESVTSSPDDDGRACQFFTSNGALLLTVRVGDLPRALLGGPEQVARLTAARAATTEPVPNLAEAALYYADPQTGSGLVLATSRDDRVTSVDISTPGPGSPVTHDALISLGRAAVRALP